MAWDEFTAFLEQNQPVTVLHTSPGSKPFWAGVCWPAGAVDWNAAMPSPRGMGPAWPGTSARAPASALERIARARHLNLRLLALVLGGAARVAALLTAGTPVLAVPLVYRYVMAVLRQMVITYPRIGGDWKIPASRPESPSDWLAASRLQPTFSFRRGFHPPPKRMGRRVTSDESIAILPREPRKGEARMPTSPELKQALKEAADVVARYVKDAATMTVETRYVEMGAEAETARLAARTTIKLDGDSESILPLKRTPDGDLVVDTVVYEMHQQNVQAAIDYRAEMLDRLLTVLRGG